VKGSRGPKFLGEMGGFEKQDDDSEDEGGTAEAVTAIDANEEEVDDIGEGCGDYYDDSVVKSASLTEQFLTNSCCVKVCLSPLHVL
jgi:hypothetical protein